VSISAVPSVLRLPHMETLGIRELQQRASSAVRRVRRGETLGVTYRGQLVAVLAPPALATGTGSLIAAGRVTPARRTQGPLPDPAVASRPTQEVLDELRSEG
jgi:antitoxin (DNA-binding transcriptional repressor) of toxin-antitoxin stability system